MMQWSLSPEAVNRDHNVNKRRTYHLLPAPQAVHIIIASNAADGRVVKTDNAPRLLVLVSVSPSFRDGSGGRRGGAVLGAESGSCGETEGVKGHAGPDPSKRGEAGGDVVFEVKGFPRCAAHAVVCLIEGGVHGQ